MATYTVTLPYKEKELGKEERQHSVDMKIDAESPMEAVQKAIDHFQSVSRNPMASWNVRVDEDGVNIREMTSGEMFRLSELAKAEKPEKEQEKLLSMEDYLKQFEAAPEDRLEVYEKAMALQTVVKNWKEASKAVLELVMAASQTEAGSVLLKDEKKKDLYFAAAAGPKAAEVMGFRVPMGKGLAGYCVETGETLAVSDVQSDPRFFKQISENLGYETRSILATPVRYGDKIFGVLELINEVPEDQFTGYDLEIGRHMAGYLALLFHALGPEKQ